MSIWRRLSRLDVRVCQAADNVLHIFAGLLRIIFFRDETNNALTHAFRFYRWHARSTNKYTPASLLHTSTNTDSPLHNHRRFHISSRDREGIIQAGSCSVRHLRDLGCSNSNNNNIRAASFKRLHRRLVLDGRARRCRRLRCRVWRAVPSREERVA